MLALNSRAGGASTGCFTGVLGMGISKVVEVKFNLKP
jgi:hypothetical protein